MNENKYMQKVNNMNSYGFQKPLHDMVTKN
jgi:hypothetical protein